MSEIRGKRLHLRPVQLSDAAGPYHRWMNDAAVTRHLESRFQSHSVESLREYIRQQSGNPDVVFLAIVLNDGNRHIGNIKLGPINRHHQLADIGIVIGERDCWGRGYATEAIELITTHAFDALGLHKTTAGCYATNAGSARAFLNAGYEQEGLRRSHALDGGAYVDVILLGKIRPDA